MTFDPATETGAAFDRTAGGNPLTFRAGQERIDGLLLMQDEETGSTWQTLTGWATDGPLAGTALKRLPSFYAFWFAWSDFPPDTELYGVESLSN